jgi:hypothetical protein
MRPAGRIGLGAAAFLGAIGGAWILSLPTAPRARTTAPIAEPESSELPAALKPPKRQWPLIAIVGINDATEATSCRTAFFGAPA